MNRQPLLDVECIEQTPDVYLNAVGNVFTVFDGRTQDSGNISYGVQTAQGRYFVKTAGHPDDPNPFLDHSERVSLLRNAVRLRRSCDHRTLPPLHQVIESPSGPLLVYQWVDGELLRVEAAMRDNPQSTFQRFRQLSSQKIIRALDLIYELHHQLAQLGWIAVDFYDGCLIYNFDRQELHIVDLDHYCKAPFINEMGRMFGSSRFMAPEEFEQGARIDEHTNVFTMGRTAAVLLSDGTLERRPFRGSDGLYEVMRRACCEDPGKRYDSMAAFFNAWTEAHVSELSIN
jgi:serine/threonine-protein kinase